MAIALIGDLPDTLADRSIEIRMRRREPGEKVERLRMDRLHQFEPLRRKAARWAADHTSELQASDPDVPDGLSDRAADNWRPLLAIADLAGGEWPEKARKAAQALSGATGDNGGDVRTLLLADLKEIFDSREVDRIPTETILQVLHEKEDRPWPEWGKKEQPITSRQLARLLQPFGVRPGPIRVGGNVPRGYKREDLEEAWRRYLPVADTEAHNTDADDSPSDPLHPLQPNNDAGLSDSSTRYISGLVADHEGDSNPHGTRIVTHVTDGSPPRGRLEGKESATDSPSDPDREVFII